MTLRISSATLAAALMLAVSVPLAVRADEHERDEMRHLVERGEIRPLSEILSVIREKLPGDVVGVEIERKNGRWLYEFRVVDPQGRLFEAHVDARSAAVERIKEK
jgi:uncharacterized membrane protein YkoI